MAEYGNFEFVLMGRKEIDFIYLVKNGRTDILGGILSIKKKS